MVFKRLLMPTLVLGMIFTMGSMAFAQLPPINCTIASIGGASAPGAPVGSIFPSLPGPTARATATGHTEPIGAGPDGTALTIPAGGGVAVQNPGGGAVRVKCTNISGGVVDPTAAPGAQAPPGFSTTTLAIGQISFGVIITNGTAHPTAATGIRIVNPTGVFTAANVGFPVPLATDPVNRTGGTVSFQMSAGAGGIIWPAGGVGTFDMDGVLVSLNGTGKTSVNATVFVGGATGYDTVCLAFGDAGTCNTASVITSVLPGLKDPTSPTVIPAVLPQTILALCGGLPCSTGGTGNFNLLGLGVKPTFVVRVEENYQDMFKTSTQFNGGGAGVFPISGASNTEVQFQFSGIPAGLIIGGCFVSLTDQGGTALTTGATALVSAASVTQLAPTLTVNFSGAMPLGTIEALWLFCTTLTDTTDTTLPAAGVTVQVSLAPAGTALSSTSGLLTGVTTGQIPRYQLALQPAAGSIVVSFPPGAVSLLVPFATVGGGYNTGIAISNTTTDPFGTGGASSVTAQSGTLTFTFYDNSGTVTKYTTSASSPGGGLSGGLLNSGKTYVVNLSELLTAAGLTSGTFTGYIFVTTNFTNAHGAAYVYNGAGFTSSTPVLVLGVTRATPEGLNN